MAIFDSLGLLFTAKRQRGRTDATLLTRSMSYRGIISVRNHLCDGPAFVMAAAIVVLAMVNAAPIDNEGKMFNIESNAQADALNSDGGGFFSSYFSDPSSRVGATWGAGSHVFPM